MERFKFSGSSRRQQCGSDCMHPASNLVRDLVCYCKLNPLAGVRCFALTFSKATLIFLKSWMASPARHATPRSGGSRFFHARTGRLRGLKLAAAGRQTNFAFRDPSRPFGLLDGEPVGSWND